MYYQISQMISWIKVSGQWWPVDESYYSLTRMKDKILQQIVGLQFYGSIWKCKFHLPSTIYFFRTLCNYWSVSIFYSHSILIFYSNIKSKSSYRNKSEGNIFRSISLLYEYLLAGNRNVFCFPLSENSYSQINVMIIQFVRRYRKCDVKSYFSICYTASSSFISLLIIFITRFWLRNGI